MEERTSMTFEQLREMVEVEANAEGTNYSPTNLLMELQHKLGNLAKFGLKKRLGEKGIGKDDPEVGLAKAKVEAGQMLWCLDAFCMRNGFNLDDARVAAHDHLLKKRG